MIESQTDTFSHCIAFFSFILCSGRKLILNDSIFLQNVKKIYVNICMLFLILSKTSCNLNKTSEFELYNILYNINVNTLTTFDV